MMDTVLWITEVILSISRSFFCKWELNAPSLRYGSLVDIYFSTFFNCVGSMTFWYLLSKMMPSLKTLTLQRLGIVTKTLQMSRIGVANLISHLAFPESLQRNLITNMLVFCRITDNKSLILVPSYESIYIIGKLQQQHDILGET